MKIEIDETLEYDQIIAGVTLLKIKTSDKFDEFEYEALQQQLIVIQVRTIRD